MVKQTCPWQLYRMTLSQSSAFQQTAALAELQSHIEEAFRKEETVQLNVSKVIEEATKLTISESYRLIIILSKHLKNSTSVYQKYIALLISKQLFLTAEHEIYVFGSTRILPWVKSTAAFQSRKPNHERAKLYLKQHSFAGNGDEYVQQRYCFTLLKFVDEYIPWFASNFPTHLNASFPFRSTFARYQQQLGKTTTKYEYFSEKDFDRFERNYNILQCERSESIKDLCDFITIQLRHAVDVKKEKYELLRDIVKTSDSYCIKAIISEASALLEDNHKLFYTIRIMQNLMNIGEVQFMELFKLYCVPILLQYCLPIDIMGGHRVAEPILKCSPIEERYINDCLYIWRSITKEVGLSVNLYDQAIRELEASKKSHLKLQQKHTNEFLTNVIDMRGVNSEKLAFVQELNTQKELIKILQNKQFKGDEPKLWKSNISAINELNDFRGSKLQASQALWASGLNNNNRSLFRSNYLLKNSYAGGIREEQQGKSSVQQSAYFNEFRVSKDKVLSSGSSAKFLLDHHALEGSQQLIRTQKMAFGSSSQRNDGLGSPSKLNYNSEQTFINKKEIIANPTRNKSSQASQFVAFDTSDISKFSQYSVKRSNQNGNVGQKLGQPAPKLQSLSEKSEQLNKSEVVYFQQSTPLQSFKSQNFQSEKSVALNQSDISKSVNRSSSPKSENPSAYDFIYSKISNSNSSHNLSRISDYGLEGYDLPEPVRKPGFNFKRGSELRKGRALPDEGSPGVGRLLESHVSMSREEYALKGDYNQGRFILNTDNGDVISEIGSQAISNSQKVVHHLGVNHQSSEIEHYPSNNYLMQESIRLSNDMNELGRQRKFRGTASPLSGTGFGKVARLNPSEKKKIKTIIRQQFDNDRLIELEREVGRAMAEKNKKMQELKEKEKQYNLLKSKCNPVLVRNMDRLKKQNEIIELLADQKNKEDYKAQGGVIKPIKELNKIEDYFLSNQVRGLYSIYAKPFQKAFVRQILGSPCLLIKNDFLELGYNYTHRESEVSLYLTLLKAYDTVQVRVVENSVTFDKETNLKLKDQPARYQLKIKRKIMEVKEKKKNPTFSQVITETPLNVYIFPEINIRLSQKGIELEKYSVKVPCSIFNLVQGIEITRLIIEELKTQRVIKSEEMPLNEQFARNTQSKIDKNFPLSMRLMDGWHMVGYQFPQRIFGQRQPEYSKFRVSQNKVQFEFFGDSKSALAESLVCILSGSKLKMKG